MATFALYCGLIVGVSSALFPSTRCSARACANAHYLPQATFWGVSADLIGRRPAWNGTLIVGAVFGIAAGAAPSFVVFCAMIALCGFGVGGNMPVDGAVGQCRRALRPAIRRSRSRFCAPSAELTHPPSTALPRVPPRQSLLHPHSTLSLVGHRTSRRLSHLLGIPRKVQLRPDPQGHRRRLRLRQVE